MSFSVKQIQNYILENSIEFREDKSNSSTQYQRNSIRKSLQYESQDKRAKYLDEIENNKMSIPSFSKNVRDTKLKFCKDKNNGIFCHLNTLLSKMKSKNFIRVIKVLRTIFLRDVFSLIDSEVGRHVANSEFRIVRERKRTFSFKNIREFKRTALINVNDTELTYPISIWKVEHSRC